jgi:hypothetical protein
MQTFEITFETTRAKVERVARGLDELVAEKTIVFGPGHQAATVKDDEEDDATE